MENLQFIKVLVHVAIFGIHTYLLSAVLVMGVKINTNDTTVVALILLYFLGAFLILSDLLCYSKSAFMLGLYGTLSLLGFMLKSYLNKNKQTLTSK